MRASAKLPVQGKQESLAPNRVAMSQLLSPEPVSTTMISSASPRAENRARGSSFSSSLTIMQRETLAPPLPAAVGIPASFLIWSAASMPSSSMPNLAAASSIFRIASP